MSLKVSLNIEENFIDTHRGLVSSLLSIVIVQVAFKVSFVLSAGTILACKLINLNPEKQLQLFFIVII